MPHLPCRSGCLNTTIGTVGCISVLWNHTCHLLRQLTSVIHICLIVEPPQKWLFENIMPQIVNLSWNPQVTFYTPYLSCIWPCSSVVCFRVVCRSVRWCKQLPVRVTHTTLQHATEPHVVCFRVVCSSDKLCRGKSVRPEWCTFFINSAWPSDARWRHRSWSTYAHAMACCLTASGHYLNQCWRPSAQATVLCDEVRKIHF